MPISNTNQASPSPIEPFEDLLQPPSNCVVQIEDSQKQKGRKLDGVYEPIAAYKKRKWEQDIIEGDADPEEGDGVEYIRKKLKSSAGITKIPPHAPPPSLPRRQQSPPSSFQPLSVPKPQLPSPPPSTGEKDARQAATQAQSITSKATGDTPAYTAPNAVDNSSAAVKRSSRPYQCNPRLYFVELQAHLAKETPGKEQT